MAKVKNKRNSGLADKVHGKKKLDGNKKKLNPFEVHINREKIKVLGKKSKHDKGLPGVSRAKAIQKRKETLGTEMKLMNKTNTFIDRRIGEKNGQLSAEDRMVARFAAERAKQHSKKNIFNLADDEILTHRGQTLEQIEKFDDPRSDDEDEDGKAFGGLDNEFVSEGHFGGGMLSRTEADGAKSHKDLIEQLIVESKKRKAEKQKEKEQTLDLTEKLDSEWKDLQPVVLKRARVENESIIDKVLSKAEKKGEDYDKMMRELKFEKRGTPSDGLKSDEKQAKEEREKLAQWERERRERMEGETVAPKAHTQKPKHRSAEDLDDNFELDDEKEFMLAYDKEGNPLVPEEVLKNFTVPNAKPKFEDGVSDTSSDDDSSDDEENDDQNDSADGNDDEKGDSNAGSDKKENENTDEESNDENEIDSDSDNEIQGAPKLTKNNEKASIIKLKTSKTVIINETESQPSVTKVNNNKILDINSKNIDESKKNKTIHDKSNKANEINDSVNKIDPKNITINNKAGKKSINPVETNDAENETGLFQRPTNKNEESSDENDGSDENDDSDDDDDDSDDESDEDKTDDFNDLKGSDDESENEIELPGEDKNKIRSFFDKKTLEGDNLKELLSDKTPAQVTIALQKLIKSYDPSLSENNKELLSRLFAHMLQYTNDIFTHIQDEGTLIKAFMTFERLVPYFYDLAKTNKVSTKKYLVELLKEKREIYMKNMRRIPDLDTLVIFKLVSILYPTSDFRHPVTTPSLIFMSEILTNSRFNNAYSITRGLFVTALILEYTVLSKRLVPSAINFLRGILYLSADTSLVNPIQAVPPFKQHKDSKLLNITSDCSKLSVNTKLSASDLVLKDITNEFKIKCLFTSAMMTKEFFDNFSDIEAQECLFESHIKLLGRVNLENYPKKVQSKVADILKDMKGSLEVKTFTPLCREKKRPKALRLYEPDVQEVFTGSKSSKLSREQAESARLKTRHKREMKGALREIRRDKAYIASVKIRQKIQSDNVRKQKVKEIFKDASIQQGEINKLKRMK